MRPVAPGRVVPRWTYAAMGLWPLALAPGFVFVERYANEPGRLAEPPATWPSDVSIVRSDAEFTLVMLAHPRCPCTRSSLRELERLMVGIDDETRAVVLFVDPVGADWAQTDLWAMADEIPGVDVLADARGETSRRFGAYTSGQVVLYDPAGRLVFNGGVTSARGHEGDNVGSDAISAIVRRGGAMASTNSVFGCDLHDPAGAR